MKILLKISFIFILSFFMGSYAIAACYCNGTISTASQSICSETPGCSWQIEGSAGGGTVTLPNPLPTANVPTLLGTIINVVLGVTGSLALAMFIFGGLTWMTSAGNSERVGKGKNILIWATIGLVIIFSAYALVKFVFTSIGAT